MILWRIAAPIFVASAVFTLFLTADAAVPVPPITAWIDAKRTFVGETTSLWIRVANDSEAPIGPLQISVTPPGVVRQPNIRFLIPPRRSVLQNVAVLSRQEGTFTIRVALSLDGQHAEPIEAGTLEIVERPSVFGRYPGLIPVIASAVTLLGTLVTLVATLIIQGRTLRATREQKSAESVAQIILATGREYYGTMSGALLRLAEAARRLDATPSPAERDHLLVRCFFFFGTFLYKENEFTFSANIIFLPDLWAEGAVRRMIDAVLALVPLDQPQEAILHKCFSDIALLQRDPSARKHVAVGAAISLSSKHCSTTVRSQSAQNIGNYKKSMTLFEIASWPAILSTAFRRSTTR